jgi:hypothetical protein
MQPNGLIKLIQTEKKWDLRILENKLYHFGIADKCPQCPDNGASCWIVIFLLAYYH